MVSTIEVSEREWMRNRSSTNEIQSGTTVKERKVVTWTKRRTDFI